MTEITVREIGMVYNLARRMTAGWGPTPWRDDMVGSGLLGLTEAAGRFDPERGAPFLAVAAISARGRMLDMLRKERRGARCVGARAQPDGPGGQQILVARDPATAPPMPRTSSLESTLTRRELVAALREAIDTLPPRERRALTACVLEGQPTADLAAELGVSRRAVNLMCTRARRRLEARLSHLGDVAKELLG
jgi:RNA polymerase sigma factor (sigma-70 family)